MPPPARRRHLSPWVSPSSPLAFPSDPRAPPVAAARRRNREKCPLAVASLRSPQPTSRPPQVGSPPHGPNPTDARLATRGRTAEEHELDPALFERAGVRGARARRRDDDDASSRGGGDASDGSERDDRSVLNDPAGFYPEEPAARRAYGRLLRHRADAAERARRHDEEHDTRTPSLTQNSTHPTVAADDEPTFVPGRTVGETAAAAARTRAAKATVAETAAFVRAAGGTAGVGGVATECGDECDVYDVNRRDLSHLRGTLRRRGDVWVTFTKIKEQVEAVLADPASVRCPHVVGTDRDAWRRSPHVAVSERVAPNTRLEMSGRSSGSSSVIARGGMRE